MTKQQLLDKLERAWEDFQGSYAGLGDERLLEPGVTGDWSVKDILAHVRAWEAESLAHLPQVRQGARLPRYKDLYGGIDAFNARVVERERALTLAEVQRRLEDTHCQLLEYLQDLPDELFTAENRFRRRLRLDTYSHYPIHAAAIREWRARSV